jgi:glycosyltransferase 2 family protein
VLPFIPTVDGAQTSHAPNSVEVTVILPCYNERLVAFLVLPLLLALLHPRAMTKLLDWLFGLLHRPPLGQRLKPRFEMRAVGWSLLSWAALGAQLLVLCTALGHGGLSAYIPCIGAIAFAVSAGVLLVLVPAGAGIRTSYWRPC